MYVLYDNKVSYPCYSPFHSPSDVLSSRRLTSEKGIPLGSLAGNFWFGHWEASSRKSCSGIRIPFFPLPFSLRAK